MQGPLQQQISTKTYDWQSSPSSSKLSKAPSTQTYPSALSSQISGKQSPIEQQILELKCNKIALNDEGVLINFINKIIHLISEAMANFKPKYMTEIVNLLLTKITTVNYTSSMGWEEKTQQIAKWVYNKLPATAAQLCSSIATYIIEEVDLSNFVQSITLLYFLLFNQLEVENKTLLACSWSIQKFINSINPTNYKGSIVFIKQIAYKIINIIDSKPTCSTMMVKAYVNFSILILKFISSPQQLQQLQNHLTSFSLVQQILMNSLPENADLFNDEKQNYFIAACEVYAITGNKKMLRIIKLFIQVGVTITMLSNFWNLFNADHNLAIFSIECLKRTSQILGCIKQKCKQSIKSCRMSARGTWVSKTLEKRTSLVILRFGMAHPRQVYSTQNRLILRLEMEMGTIQFCAKTDKSDPKAFGLWVKKYSRHSDPNKQEKQQFLITNGLQFCISTLIIEFRAEKKLWICSETARLTQINHALMGRPKSLLIGVRKQQNQMQSILRRIFTFVALDDTTFEQYLKQHEILRSSSAKNDDLTSKLPLKRSNSDNPSKAIDKFDLLEFVEGSKQKQSVQKLKHITTTLTYQNIKVVQNKEYMKMIPRFSGKQKLPSYILNAFEAVKNDEFLECFIVLLRKQWKLFDMSEQDFHELSFLHGHSLFLKKPFTLINEIIQFMPSKSTLNKTSQKKAQENQRMLLLKLQLLLKKSLETENNNNQATYLRNTCAEIVEQYFLLNTKNIREDEIALMKLCSFLNSAVMGCINDYAVRNQFFASSPRRKKNSISIENNTKQKDETPQYRIVIESPESVEKFVVIVLQCFRTVLDRAKSDYLVINNITMCLQTILVTLSYISLREKPFQPDFILPIINHTCSLLQYLSTLLAQIKNVTESDQNKISAFLSEMYNMLPALIYYSKSFDKKSEMPADLRDFYQSVYVIGKNNEGGLKDDPFFLLMRELYRVCFKIGSFCLKDRKSGFLSYMAYAYRFLSTYKDNMNWDQDSNVLTYKDRIAITQTYTCCFQFTLLKNHTYTFDTDTQIQIIQKLSDLCLPISQKLVVKKIVSFYVFLCLPQDFPINILANVERADLESIFTAVLKQISNFKAQQRVAQLMYLINLVNFYVKYIDLSIDISPYQKIGAKYNELSKLYNWYQVFSLIKKIHYFLKQPEQQKKKSNLFPSGVTHTLKKLNKLLIDKFNEDPIFTNLKYLMKNFTAVDEEKNSNEENLQHLLPFIQVLFNQFEKINSSFNFFDKSRRQKKKQIDFFALPSKQQFAYFCTERVQGQSKQEKQKPEQISKKLCKKIFGQHSQYFTEVYSKLAKDKNKTLIAYYKMIEKLSFEEKLYNMETSQKYKAYDYYILDDYLNDSNTKVMLKRDPVSILGNLISGQIPRLYEQKEVFSHTLYALKITKNISDLNKNPFFQINLQAELKLNQVKGKEQKGKATIPAVLVTKSKIYQGKIEIYEKGVFFTENTFVDPNLYKQLYANRSQYRTLQQISVSRKTIFIDVTEADYCVKKSYLQLFPALEVYAGRLSYFFVFSNKEDREKFQGNSDIYFPQPFQLDQWVNESMQKWKSGWIDNFSLLIKVNNISGRSFNDVSQYYVFPWTVINFQDVMNQQFFKKKQNFRDLSKPIGSLNPVKLRTILEKYENFNPGQQNLRDKSYMYGSFYSNPGVVCNYLLRVNPFTTHHYQLQGNQFDLYDRLFTNMEDQYESIYHSLMDNRQLVPQFYCAPQFFRNRNRYNFAHSQPKQNKCDLVMRMPKWVVTGTPQEFVFRMRKGLQSSLVSLQLGAWIDLIFGYKSQQEHASEHKNLYIHQLYRTKEKKTAKEQQLTQSQADKSSMIKLFGQVPKNIFGNKPSLKPIQHSIANSIYCKNTEYKKIFSSDNSKQKGKGNLLFDVRDSIFTISENQELLIFNENEEINKLKVSMDETFLSLSILNFNKSNFFLLFAITTQGQLYLYTVKKSYKASLIKKSEFKIDKKVAMFSGCRFNQVKTIYKYVIISEQTSTRVLQISKEKTASTIQNLMEDYYLNDRGYISLHRSPITNLETYQKLQIVVSIDTSGLVNVFNVHPELSIRSTFTLSSALKVSQKVTKILPHQMGILVMLTSFNQIIICNIYGDLIQRVYIQDKDIADIVLWDDEASSQILISTKFGLLYQLDLFDMLNNEEECLLGLSIKIGGRKCVEAPQKCANKLAINRFGRFWELYIISSTQSIMVVQCYQFHKNYQSRQFKHNCNHNNSYKNT